MSGPLNGLRVLEIGSIGPGPFTGMMLADMGADVLRVDRARDAEDAPTTTWSPELLHRGRRSVALDLKSAAAVSTVLSLVAQADVLLEGFRPGVMERLGLGPEVCLDRNKRLVYGRMTGWGQSGPLADVAGHDINYIALAGALAHIGRAGEPPAPPLNLVGDFGGGGMLLAFGIACAVFEAGRSGQGQVVDAAMTDGTALLMTMTHMFDQMGRVGVRGTNLLDGGAPFYDAYECADGRFLSVGAIEPQFYGALIDGLGLISDIDPTAQLERDQWPRTKALVADRIRTRTCDEWVRIFAGVDACIAPVLTMAEAADHPHNATRGTFVTYEGARQPAPAPRFSRTPGSIRRPPPHIGQDTRAALLDWHISTEEIDALLDTGSARQMYAVSPQAAFTQSSLAQSDGECVRTVDRHLELDSSSRPAERRTWIGEP